MAKKKISAISDKKWYEKYSGKDWEPAVKAYKELLEKGDLEGKGLRSQVCNTLAAFLYQLFDDPLSYNVNKALKAIEAEIYLPRPEENNIIEIIDKDEVNS